MAGSCMNFADNSRNCREFLWNFRGVDVWLGTNHSMLMLIRSDGTFTFGWGVVDPLETRPSPPPLGSATMPNLFCSQFAVGQRYSVRMNIYRAPPFKVTQAHWKCHGSIIHWLPVSDPQWGPTVGLSRTVSYINSDNGGKRKFSHPVYLMPRWNFVTL